MNSFSIPVLPRLPSQFSRFDVQNIKPDIYHESCELGTRDFIHPEGSRFYYLEPVVSNVPITAAVHESGCLILEKAGLGSNNSERRMTACLMFDDKESCVGYYIADHSARMVVWVDGDHVPDMVFPVDSMAARNMLSEEYWTHMENFPVPTSTSLEDLNDLKSVLASLAIGKDFFFLIFSSRANDVRVSDSATSEGSTSPFTTDQSRDFLAILDKCNGPIGGQETYIIARLWGIIWRARVRNGFGTPEACLDRFTALSELPPRFDGPYSLCAKYSIGANVHLERCSRAWAGRIAYMSEWRDFKAKNELEWIQVIYLACLLIIASLINRTQSNIPMLSDLALLFECASAAISYYLLTELQNRGKHAADASVYFQSWGTTEDGIQTLALRNSVPRALLAWGFLVFLVSIFLGIQVVKPFPALYTPLNLPPA